MPQRKTKLLICPQTSIRIAELARLRIGLLTGPKSNPNPTRAFGYVRSARTQPDMKRVVTRADTRADMKRLLSKISISLVDKHIDY